MAREEEERYQRAHDKKKWKVSPTFSSSSFVLGSPRESERGASSNAHDKDRPMKKALLSPVCLPCRMLLNTSGRPSFAEFHFLSQHDANGGDVTRQTTSFSSSSFSSNLIADLARANNNSSKKGQLINTTRKWSILGKCCQLGRNRRRLFLAEPKYQLLVTKVAAEIKALLS